jgi:hypothetical protein
MGGLSSEPRQENISVDEYLDVIVSRDDSRTFLQRGNFAALTGGSSDLQTCWSLAEERTESDET